MKQQIVRARVPEEARDRYLEAWAEWSGRLFPMGIETLLLESQEERGRFVEITRFGEGEEAALSDDRLVAAAARMEAAAATREGALEFFAPVSP